MKVFASLPADTNSGPARLQRAKRCAVFAIAVVSAAFSQSGLAQISAYSQDFEGLVLADPSALSNDGWIVGGNVFNDAALTSFDYGYFAFPAPNGGAAFSAIDAGQGGAPQGAQQFSVYNDYNNADHGVATTPGPFHYIQAHVFQEQNGAIAALNVGETVVLSFDSKVGNLISPSTSDAFIKVLKTSDASFAQLGIVSVNTHTLGANWVSSSINLVIDPSWVGETIQFGFRNVATNFQASGVFYDNILFTVSSPDTDDDGNPDGNDPNVNTATVVADSGPAPVGSATNFNVLANDDFLPNNDPNNVGTTTLTDTGNGTAGGTIVPNATTGEIAYTPLAGEAGSSVTVEYEVCNTDPIPDVCGTAILTVNVSAAGAGCSVPCTLIWEDTFTGTSLDLSKWEYQIGDGTNYGIAGWGNNELQYYRDGNNNTTVGPDAQADAGGVLTITAKQENFGGKPYTSARIRTRNQGDWAYGRFEARIKLPQNQGATTGGQGTWPAFWLLPYNSPYGGRGWPFHGEIDIMEWLGHEPNDLFGTIHYPCCGPGNATSANSSGTTFLPSPLDWHTYAVEWEPGVMRWYLDGSSTPFLTKSSWNAGGIPYQAPFDVPNFHIILNLAIGGNFPGNPDGTSIFPQEFKIDYVRVYDMGSTITPATPPVTDPILLDDFEHNDSTSQWGLYVDGPSTGSRSNSPSPNVPPTNGGGNAMDVSFDGNPGAFWGTIFHNQSMDLSAMTQLSFWINPDVAGQTYNLEINIQDDDSGEGNWTPTLDDEFQFICTISPSGPCAVAGGGWQQVFIPLSSFTHDTSFASGGNGTLDTAAGGNGLAETITIAIVDQSGGTSGADFITDYWLFENTDPCVPSQFGAGCTIDTDGDGDPDSVEGEFTDTDGDGTPDYQESSIVDTDGDGVFDEQDPDNLDPCIPSQFGTNCTTDTDGDGEADSLEGEFADADGDGTPDYLESSIDDSDGDGTVDEADFDNDDPCVPDIGSPACIPTENVPIQLPALLAMAVLLLFGSAVARRRWG